MIVVIATLSTGAVLGGYNWFLRNQIDSVRQQIRVVEAERDAARRAIEAMESERIAADRRNRAATAGREAINSVPEGEHTLASETLLKSMQAADNVGGLK